MAIKYINGSDKPRFVIRNPNTNDIVETITLPITNESGMEEETEEDKITHEFLYQSRIEDYVRGYRIRWRLPYDQYADLTTSKAVQTIMRYRRDRYKIFFTPRIDVPLRNFEVNFRGAINQGVNRGGQYGEGNRLMVLNFETKYAVFDMNWMDPNEVIYTGWFQGPRFSVSLTA